MGSILYQLWEFSHIAAHASYGQPLVTGHTSHKTLLRNPNSSDMSHLL